MTDRHSVAVDRIRAGTIFGTLTQVGDDLVSEKVEINPFPGTATFLATENRSIKLPRRSEIVNGKGEMKRSERIHRSKTECFVTMSRASTIESKTCP